MIFENLNDFTIEQDNLKNDCITFLRSKEITTSLINKLSFTYKVFLEKVLIGDLLYIKIFDLINELYREEHLKFFSINHSKDEIINYLHSVEF